MKISKLGKKRQKNLTFLSQLTPEEISVKYAADIERARAYLEKRRAQFAIAVEKSGRRFDELKIEGGVLAGPILKREKSKVFKNGKI